LTASSAPRDQPGGSSDEIDFDRFVQLGGLRVPKFRRNF